MTDCASSCKEVNVWSEGCSSVKGAMEACDTKVGEQRFMGLGGQQLFQLTAFDYTPGTNSLQVHKEGLLVDPQDVVELSSTTFWIQNDIVNAGDVVVASALTGVTGVVSILVSNISTFPSVLADGQQTVQFPTAVPIEYSSLYVSGLLVDNGRLVKDVDYTQDNLTNIVYLVDSYPAGTILLLAYNDVGEGLDPLAIVPKNSVDAIRADFGLATIAVDGQQISLSGYYENTIQGGGIFMWYSTSTDVDDGGLTLLPTTWTGPGRWKRILSKKLNVNDFGAKSTVGAIVDDTLAIQATSDTTLPFELTPEVIYKLTASLELRNSLHGNNATLQFEGTTISRLVNKIVPGDVQDLIIDGSLVTNTDHGFFVDAQYSPDIERYKNITVQNLTNSSNAIHGIILYRATTETEIGGNFYVDHCHAKNIVAVGNNVVQGIIIGFNNASIYTNGYIDKCTVKDITPAADGDGIHVLNESKQVPTATNNCIISDCHVASDQAFKRCYKVQWNNCVVDNCFGRLDNANIGISAYSRNTVIDNCTFQQEAAASGDVFDIQTTDYTISNCNVNLVTTAGHIVRMKATENGIISKLNVNMANAHTVNSLAVFLAEGTEKNIVISDCIVNNVGGAGVGVRALGSSTIQVNHCVFDGVPSAFNTQFSDGHLTVNDTKVYGAVYGFQQVAGEAGFTITMNDCEINASSAGVIASGTGIGANINMSRCTVNTTNHGILATNALLKANIANCILNASAATGVGVSVRNEGVVSTCRTTGFLTGIQAVNAVNAEFRDNVTINCTTDYDKTGSTLFVDTDNFSR